MTFTRGEIRSTIVAAHGRCDHGLTRYECPICTKLVGECDFGDCIDTATVLAQCRGTRRRFCDRCAALAVACGIARSTEPLPVDAPAAPRRATTRPRLTCN